MASSEPTIDTQNGDDLEVEVQNGIEQKTVEQKTEEQKTDEQPQEDIVDQVTEEFNEMLRESLNELMQRVRDEFHRYELKIQDMKTELIEREKVLTEQKNKQDIERQKWEEMNKLEEENSELVEQV